MYQRDTEKEANMLKRINGTCIWFSDKKGYGFIKSDDGSSSMAHYTNIKEHGYKRLYPGQRVTYIEKETPKGLLAVDIKYIKDFSRVDDRYGIPLTTSHSRTR